MEDFDERHWFTSMKKFILVGLSSLVVVGCSTRAPMEFKNESIYATDIQVRNSIIRNAADQKWNICQEEGNRLRADLTYNVNSARKYN